MEVVQSKRVLMEVAFCELRLQEIENKSCMVHRGLGVLPKPPSETGYMALMSLFVRIGTPQVGNWQYRFPSAMEFQLIQHGNVRPHTSLRTQEAIAKYSWTLLCHPPIFLIWRRQIFAFYGSLKMQ
jgi:hypothetical protein